MLEIYGTNDCRRCINARRWLTERSLPHGFYDVRHDPISAATVEHWVDQLGWERLVNRRGTVWRGLPEASKTGLDNQAASRLIMKHPMMLRCPVVGSTHGWIAGFSASDRIQVLGFVGEAEPQPLHSDAAAVQSQLSAEL